VIQNFHGVQEITTLVGDKQSLTGGPVASQEAIKELGTTGAGLQRQLRAPLREPQRVHRLAEI